MRRHQAGADLAGRRPLGRHRAGVHAGPLRPARQPVQLTTDGHRAYLQAVRTAFGAEIDYAMLIKICGTGDDRAYSPARCTAPSA